VITLFENCTEKDGLDCESKNFNVDMEFVLKAPKPIKLQRVENLIAANKSESRLADNQKETITNTTCYNATLPESGSHPWYNDIFGCSSELLIWILVAVVAFESLLIIIVCCVYTCKRKTKLQSCLKCNSNGDDNKMEMLEYEKYN